MLLDEKRYPNGINPVVSDEVSEDVAYQMKESGIDLHGEFSRKLATIGRDLVVNSENDRSYDQLMETLRDLLYSIVSFSLIVLTELTLSA